MKKTKLLLLSNCVIATLSCFAQNPIVLVLDGNENNAPLSKIQVYVTNTEAGGRLVAEGISTTNGIVSFSPSSFARGKYKTTLLNHPLYGMEQKEDVDFTQDTVRLVMGVKNKQLDEVSVTAIRQQVKQDAKGSSMDLTKIPQVKYWTLEDALKHIPGIEIKDNNIFYQGEAVQLKENKFESPSMRRNLVNYLKMPASNFSNIDLTLMDLTSLSGSASLNFTRIKTSADVWGNVMGGAGLINQNLSGAIGMKRDKSLIEISPNYYQIKQPQSTNKGLIKHTGSDEITKIQSASDMPLMNSGVDFRYNYSTSKHLLNLTGAYNISEMNIKQQTLSETYQNSTLIEVQPSDFTLNNKGNNLSFTAGYNWTINKSSQLYAFLKGEHATLDNDNYNRTPNPTPNAPSYNRYQSTFNDNYYGVISYGAKSKNIGSIEAGSKYFNRKQEVTTGSSFFIDDTSDSSTYSAYTNTYHYVALFCSWAKMIKSVSFNASLTTDYSEDRIPSHDNQVFRYFTLYPYLALFRNFNGHSIRFTTSYREKRPAISSLNPIADPIMTPSGLIILRGNPDLKTSKETQLTANYSAIWFGKMQTNISINYTYSSGNIQSVYYSSDTVLFRSFFNLSNQQKIYCNLLLQYPITKQLRGTLTTSARPSTVRPTPDAPATWYRGYSGNLQLDYEIIKNCMQLSLSAEYLKSDSYQHSQSGSWKTNINATYTKKNWFITLFISNPVQPTITTRTQNDAIGYTSNYISTRKQFDAGTSIRYYFGKEKTTRIVKPITVDDI